MDSIVVTGGGELQGEIPIAGAKNACLTLMPATLLSEEPLTLTNAPRLSGYQDDDLGSWKAWGLKRRRCRMVRCWPCPAMI